MVRKKVADGTTQDIATYTYTLDPNGNQTARGADTFECDHDDRLTRATIGANVSTSVYNGDGLRMGHTAGTTTTS